MLSFTVEQWQYPLCEEIKKEIERLGCAHGSSDPVYVEPDVDESFRVYNSEDFTVYVDGKEFLKRLKEVETGSSGGWVWFMAGQSSIRRK